VPVQPVAVVVHARTHLMLTSSVKTSSVHRLQQFAMLGGRMTCR
jgi:hypothetical protein